MLSFGQLDIARKTRLITGLAVLNLALVIAAGGYVLSLYEELRRDIGIEDIPALNRISELNRELAEAHVELLTLIQRAREGRVAEEDMYRTGKPLLDRIDAMTAQAAAPEFIPGHIPTAAAGRFEAELKAYRGSLVSSVEMLSVNLALAERYATRASVDALAVNRTVAALLDDIDRHMQAQTGEVGATLRTLVLPLLALLSLATAFFLLLLHRLGASIAHTFSATHEALSRLRAGDIGTAIRLAPDTPEAHDINEALERFRATLVELQENRQELDYANTELESFAYSIAHDLRTPLRGINGYSAILAEDYAGRLDATALEHLGRIRAGTERMGQLIDELSALTRVSRAPLRRQAVDLSAMVREIAAALAEDEPQRRADWIVAPGIVAVADPGLVSIALSNLLDNAWKFTSKREDARIEFGATSSEGKQVCYVRDNGAGFDPAFADKLFRQFQRLHSEREFEGSGIGLAIVRRIVTRHGGRIWAESRQGEGACFYFTLD